MSAQREIRLSFEWNEERWLGMLWDLEYAVRRQRLKWFLILWLTAPALIIGFGGWTALLSIRLFGVPVLEPESPDAWWQALILFSAAALLWPLVAWAAKRFFCRMMLGTFRREPAARAAQSWRIGAERIHIATGRGSSTLDWSQVSRVLRTPHGYWLAQEETKGLFLPLFALEDAGEREAFEQLLAGRNLSTS